jgi:hypothetical protein
MTVHSQELNAELLSEDGEVSYIAAFPDTFVSHTEAEARATIEKFRVLGKPLALYRVELLQLVNVPVAPSEAVTLPNFADEYEEALDD